MGVVTIAVAGAALLAVLAAWRRIPGGAALLLVGVLGATIGAGALALQTDPTPVEWLITVVVLGAAAPAHFRVALGPPGGEA